MSIKKIGLLTLWANDIWTDLIIDHALENCDELHISVIPFSKDLKKFEDDTYEKVLRKSLKSNKIKVYTLDNLEKEFLEKQNFSSKYAHNKGYHATSKSLILNKMLSKSQYFEEGNWIWIFDSDEFYNTNLIEEINKVIDDDKHNEIEINCKFYFINFSYFLITSHTRLFKISNINLLPLNRLRFRPTQKWRNINKRIYSTNKKNLMNHYSFLTNPLTKLNSWKNEFYSNLQNEKINWYNKIYMNIDIENIKDSLKLMKDFFNVDKIYFDKGDFIFNDKSFFINEEYQPKIIQESGLLKVKDFRKFYSEYNAKFYSNLDTNL